MKKGSRKSSVLKGIKRNPVIEDGKVVKTEKGSIKGVGGRPKNAKNKTTLFKEAMRDGFEARLEIDGEKVFNAVVQKAIGPPSRDKDGELMLDENGKQMYVDGDTSAQKLILDRIIPVTRAGEAIDDSGSRSIVINVSAFSSNVSEMDAIDVEYEES